MLATEASSLEYSRNFQLSNDEFNDTFVRLCFYLYFRRWLRLLFGREFPIHDLLFLWDAIFAYRPPLSLVDYIFVAMLEQIRHLSWFTSNLKREYGLLCPA